MKIVSDTANLCLNQIYEHPCTPFEQIFYRIGHSFSLILPYSIAYYFPYRISQRGQFQSWSRYGSRRSIRSQSWEAAASVRCCHRLQDLMTHKSYNSMSGQKVVRHRVLGCSCQLGNPEWFASSLRNSQSSPSLRNTNLTSGRSNWFSAWSLDTLRNCW